MCDPLLIRMLERQMKTYSKKGGVMTGGRGRYYTVVLHCADYCVFGRRGLFPHLPCHSPFCLLTNVHMNICALKLMNTPKGPR
jgi:hypothetical protein